MNNEKTFKKSFFSRFIFTKNLNLIIPFILFIILFVIVPLIVIIVNTFNNSTGNITNNWGIMTGSILTKIGNSLWISIVTTIIVLLLSFPFAYFLSKSSNKIFQVFVVMIVTGPIWINILIKLIGIKTIFDLLNHELNSTYGHIYTIIGLVYIYAPLMMLPIYNALQTLPKNLINASKDLGRGNFYTFFAIVIPWCWPALVSGIILVLLPSFTTVSVPLFLNNSNDGGLIGDVIMNQGNNGLSNSISLARTSVLVLVISGIMLLLYATIVWLPKLVQYIIHRKRVKNETKNS